MDKVVKYARNRGVDVMVEIDTPGHTYSWGHGAPHLLATCYNVTTGEPTGACWRSS
jgi:hexosaminidase